jgi:hypothetical protein
MESSAALGFGFRCGFLGLLHLEIIQERLTREFDLDLITTAPSVVYRIVLRASRTDPAAEILLHNPADYPDSSRIESIEEPWIKARIYTPDEYLGSILKLCQGGAAAASGVPRVASGELLQAVGAGGRQRREPVPFLVMLNLFQHPSGRRPGALRWGAPSTSRWCGCAVRRRLGPRARCGRRNGC